MQRMFFHNQYDAESRKVLATLDSDVLVYDVFGKDRHNLPDNIRLTFLPYFIDKCIKLETPLPCVVGTFVLQFRCYDYKDNHITMENSLFKISIDGKVYDVKADDGIIEVEIDCPDPTKIETKIEGYGYLPFETEIEVVDSAST
ncbi:MAG: hypothetical protein JRD89_04990 [Deltaproteobacteria bacterium]|nr:hypothetical protein [Deltaproteobacteria bacterium]